MDSTRSRVLVVGAGPGMALLLKLVLRREGYDVEYFPDLAGVVLMDEQDSAQVAAVIVDIETPGFLRPRERLPRHEQLPAPVIVLAGSDVQHAWHTWGADAAIEKPFNAEELTSTVHALARSA